MNKLLVPLQVDADKPWVSRMVEQLIEKSPPLLNHRDARVIRKLDNTSVSVRTGCIHLRDYMAYKTVTLMWEVGDHKVVKDNYHEIAYNVADNFVYHIDKYVSTFSSITDSEGEYHQHFRNLILEGVADAGFVLKDKLKALEKIDKLVAKFVYYVKGLSFFANELPSEMDGDGLIYDHTPDPFNARSNDQVRPNLKCLYTREVMFELRYDSDEK